MTDIALSIALTLVAMFFVEFLMPVQSLKTYETLSKRSVHIPNKPKLGAIGFMSKATMYILVLYLSFETVKKNELYSLLLASLVVVLCLITTYFRSFRYIISDIKSKPVADPE